MNILQRIKDGANRATERAQNVVEIGKINSQISNIEREMDVHFTRIGEVFYEGYRAEDMSFAEKEMMELAKTCDSLYEEIEQLRERIAELKNERLCKCGEIAPLAANFCPNCGRKLVQVSNESNLETEQDDDKTVPVYLPKVEEKKAEVTRVTEADTIVFKQFVKAPEPASERSSEETRRLSEDLERERERQQELDRRIRSWRQHLESTNEQSASVDTDQVTVKCQICSADLSKGSKWCPHCGAEQI
ncbi:zinc ribbon domain-containing protein [Paenibacillus sediminis]|uniref:Chromosome segregation ATPase n=1 Tax=Paenibacillus sediminis TaxID=664909 RepID=A0ABS4H7U8_9BACL|nr:zinc ribbon domain-containing protein [Paenibacillus sediminis]MBP1938546.1 chromosome segregation ATPase [Paenibacillus sediminis]